MVYLVEHDIRMPVRNRRTARVSWSGIASTACLCTICSVIRPTPASMCMANDQSIPAGVNRADPAPVVGQAVCR